MAKTRDYMDYLDEHIEIAPANSQEEYQAATTIAEVMRDHGLEANIEEFDAYPMGTLANSILAIALFVSLLVTGLTQGAVHVIALLLAVAAVGVMLLCHYMRNVFEGFGSPARSQNVVAVHRAEGEHVVRGARPIVIVAHYDTPRESLLRRGALAHYSAVLPRLAIPCCIAVAVSLLFQAMAFLPGFIRMFMWVVGMLACLPVLALAVVTIVDRTLPCTLGANDNKSSVAAMLAILNKVRPADDRATHDAEERPARRRSTDAPPAPPAPKRVEVTEEVKGVRHGAQVLGELGILPASCEVIYEEPKVRIVEQLPEPVAATQADDSEELQEEPAFEPERPREPADIEAEREETEDAGELPQPADESEQRPRRFVGRVDPNEFAPASNDEGVDEDEATRQDMGDNYEEEYDEEVDYDDPEEYDEYDSRSDDTLARGGRLAAVGAWVSGHVANIRERFSANKGDDVEIERGSDRTVDEGDYDYEYDYEYDDYDDPDAQSYDSENDDRDDVASVSAEAEPSGDQTPAQDVRDAPNPDFDEEDDDAESLAHEDVASEGIGGASAHDASGEETRYAEPPVHEEDEASAEPKAEDVAGPRRTMPQLPVIERDNEGADDVALLTWDDDAESVVAGDAANDDAVAPATPAESDGRYESVEPTVPAEPAQTTEEAETTAAAPIEPASAQEPYNPDYDAYEDDPDAPQDRSDEGAYSGAYEEEYDDQNYDDSYDQNGYEYDEQGYEAGDYEEDSYEESPRPRLIDRVKGFFRRLGGEEDAYYDEYDEYDDYEDERYRDDEPESYENADEDAQADEPSEQPYEGDGERDVHDYSAYDRHYDQGQGRDGYDEQDRGGYDEREPEGDLYGDPYPRDERPDDYHGEVFEEDERERLSDDRGLGEEQASGNDGEDEYAYVEGEPVEYAYEEYAYEEYDYEEYQDDRGDEGPIAADQGADQPDDEPLLRAPVDPNQLHLDQEEDADVAPRDTSGLDTISDSYDLLANGQTPAAQRERPRPIDDPNWGVPTYQPARPSVNIARRAALFDLPDPSAATIDPLANVGTYASEDAYEEEDRRDVSQPEPQAPVTDGRDEGEAPADQDGGLQDTDAQGVPVDWKGGAALRSDLREGEPLVIDEADLQDAILEMGDDFLVGHDIWFVATGASAVDHAGIKAFLADHRRDIRGAFLINLSCVGAGDLSLVVREGLRAPRRADRRLVRMLTDVAGALHINLDTLTLDWAEEESVSAMRARVRAVSIVGVDDNGLPALSRTSDDVPDLVNPDQVDSVVRMVTELIRRS